MFRGRQSFLLIVAISCLATVALGIYLSGGTRTELIHMYLKNTGYWAPLIYITLYVIATTLILPSTALNLAGGAMFGPWMGTLWTSIAAMIAAIATFLFTRTIGHTTVKKRLPSNLETIDSEINQAGLFYIFAIRLLPIIPYGIVNFSAGLTSISFKDYVVGTLLGTIPGVFPFVLMGSSGLTAVRTGEVLPLVISLGLISLLIIGSTWYSRHRNKKST